MKEQSQRIRVFKFGGASVKDAQSLLNVAHILDNASKETGRIVVVVSAMGKTTNALEAIVQLAGQGLSVEDEISRLINTHKSIALATIKEHSDVFINLSTTGEVLTLQANRARELPFDEAYDQVVSLGEVLSSQILFAVLNEHISSVGLLDARLLVKTDSTFRSPHVDARITQRLIIDAVESNPKRVLVVQGFLGSDDIGRTTTLGREGSDYTAALFGNALEAESVTVWKDVPGVLNADPKRLPSATLLPKMTYAEAAEMTYYGATVIHPKTLKPLADVGVPLFVRSFVNPESPGTYIGGDTDQAEASNVLLYLEKIALITCQTKDLRFVSELLVSQVMRTAFDVGLQVLMVQNSALEMQLVVAQDFQRAGRLAEVLEKEYHVSANYNLTLQTFLRADAEFIHQNIGNKPILLQQKTTNALRVLIRA
jgi:aspartate kinase